MANEAVILFEGNAVQIPFTVDNATAIAKGSVLKLTDPNTGIITSGNAEVLAGIAGSAKIAGDGLTLMGVWRSGVIAKMVASGSITVGKAVCSAGGAPAHVNMVYEAPLTCSGSGILGHALETATAGETLKVYINVGGCGNGLA